MTNAIEQTTAERPHCVISGSKMKQFLACPTYLYAHPDDLVDDRPKTAAEEGERAHDLAERCFWDGEAAFKGCRNKRMMEGARLYAQTLLALSEGVTLASSRPNSWADIMMLWL